MAECKQRIGGTISFQCGVKIPEGKEAHDGPCSAIENPASMATRARWEEQQREAAQLRQFQGLPKTSMERTESVMPPPGWVLCSFCEGKQEARSRCRPCGGRGYVFPGDASDEEGVEYVDDLSGVKLGPGDECVPVVRDGVEQYKITRARRSVTSSDTRIVQEVSGVPVEPTKQRPGDQPLPERNDEPGVQDRTIRHVTEEVMAGRMNRDVAVRVIADLLESKRVGVERYGTPLQTWNGRDALLDALQEARDHYVYMTAIMMAREAQREKLVAVVREALVQRENSGPSLPSYQSLAEVAVDAILKQVGLLPGAELPEVE